MRKISGIIPSSPRVTTVDLANSGAARPGMPTFGRVPGTSALKNNNKAYMTSFTNEVNGHPHLGRRGQLDPTQERAQIVADVSNGFFMKKANVYKQQMEEVMNPTIPKIGAEVSSPVAINSSSPIEISADVQLQQDPRLSQSDIGESGIEAADQEMDTAVIGHYLDVSV